MPQKYTLNQIAGILGVYDLRKTTSRLSGEMYTAKKAGVKGRIFVAWSREQMIRDHHIGETGPV